MNPRPAAAYALVLATLAPGCAVENPRFIRDSTGAELGWDCPNGDCRPVRESFSPLPPMCSGDPELLVGAGGLAILCAVGLDVDGRDILHETTCRPLVCLDELDCPQWQSRPYGCSSGICELNASIGIRFDRVDMIALCLKDVPRHNSCAESLSDPAVQSRLSLVASVCTGDECTAIPDDCLPPPDM